MNVLKNKWASAVYAVVIVLVAFIAMKGQPNAQFFAMSLGVLGILGKELVNNQMNSSFYIYRNSNAIILIYQDAFKIPKWRYHKWLEVEKGRNLVLVVLEKSLGRKESKNRFLERNEACLSQTGFISR